MPNERSTRIGVVGCGAVADLHLHALAAIPGAKCTALFDIDRRKALAARTRHGLDAEIVDDPRAIAGLADAAVVAVPNAYHAQCAIPLLGSGLHVLCEKPLATSVADAREMVAIAEQERRILVCGLVRRFFGSTELSAEALRRRLVGIPLHCEVRESLRGWPSSKAVFDRGISGGGILIDTGPHVLDLLAHLFGPLELLEYRDDNEGGVEANAFLSARCEKDCGSVTTDVHLSRGVEIPSRWRITCSEGAIEIDPHEKDSVKLCFDGEPSQYVTSASVRPVDPFVKQWRNFLAAMNGNGAPRAPARESISTIELIEKCYRTRQKYSEEWDGSLDRPPIQIGRPHPKKILVTGAAGKIGSRFVEIWAAQNRLSMLRCMVRGYESASRVMRYPAEVVEGDLSDPCSVRRAVEGCDAIIHLGCGQQIGRETQCVLEAAREFKVRRLIHLSSACVYGLGLPSRVEQFQEDSEITKTGEMYADGKREAEFAVMRAVRKGLSAVILRPHVVYGPGMRWSAELIQLLARDEICVLEDGGWANLIYVDDLVAAISRALESDLGGGQAFFVTDGNPIRWSDYIAAHADLIGASPPRVFRQEVVRPKGGIREFMRESLRPLFPVLRSPEFRSFILKSPIMQATVFRAYLSLRERPSVQRKLETLKNGASNRDPDPHADWNEHWINLQLSGARLSPQRAEQKLGFRAQIDFTEGLERSRAWFRRYGLVPPEAAEGATATPTEHTGIGCDP